MDEVWRCRPRQHPLAAHFDRVAVAYFRVGRTSLALGIIAILVLARRGEAALATAAHLIDMV